MSWLNFVILLLTKMKKKISHKKRKYIKTKWDRWLTNKISEIRDWFSLKQY